MAMRWYFKACAGYSLNHPRSNEFALRSSEWLISLPALRAWTGHVTKIPAHFRGKPRPGRRVSLSYRTESGSDEIESFTRNIGAGGAFILSETPLPVGTELSLSLRIPTSGEPICLAARVCWCSRPEDASDDAGMGVKFLDVELDTLLSLERYFASLTGTESDPATEQA